MFTKNIADSILYISGRNAVIDKNEIPPTLITKYNRMSIHIDIKMIGVLHAAGFDEIAELYGNYNPRSMWAAEFIYPDDEVIEYLKKTSVKLFGVEDYFLPMLNLFRPSVLGAPYSDFEIFIKNVIDKATKPSPQLGSWRYSIPGNVSKHRWFTPHQNDWRITSILNRKFPASLMNSAGSNNSYNSAEATFSRVLGEYLVNPKTEDTEGLRKLLLMNEFLNDRSVAASTTFGEYWSKALNKELPDAVQDNFDDFMWLDHPDVRLLDLFKSIGSRKNIASLSSSNQKRCLKILESLDKEQWVKAVDLAKDWKSAASFEQTKEFVKKINTELGRTEYGFPVYSKYELNRELIGILVNSFENDTKLTQREKNVYFEVLSKIATDGFKNNVFMSKFIADTRAREAAGNVFRMTHLLGFLVAVQNPESWIRGKRTDAEILLNELLSSDDGFSRLDFILEVIKNHNKVPTATEWRKAIADELLDSPASWVMPLIVSAKAKPKPTNPGILFSLDRKLKLY